MVFASDLQLNFQFYSYIKTSVLFARQALYKHCFRIGYDAVFTFRNVRKIEIIAAFYIFLVVFANDLRIAFEADINRRRVTHNETSAVLNGMAHFRKARRIVISFLYLSVSTTVFGDTFAYAFAASPYMS